jgi:hypothetical protein
MKLVMTLLVRDEQDIIADNLDFHLAQGVDVVLVTDNFSENVVSDTDRDDLVADTRLRDYLRELRLNTAASE